MDLIFERSHEPKSFTVVMSPLELNRSSHPHITLFTGFGLKNKNYLHISSYKTCQKGDFVAKQRKHKLRSS